MNTPILFLIFNRPDLTERVFATIREARPTKLFIAADGPRKNKDGEAELCRQARSIVINHIDWNCEVQTLIRDENLGCKIAVSEAITWFFENVEEGIILEDDILPNHSFFTFCEEMLLRYRNDERVSQITGVNLMGELAVEGSYFFSKIGGIWGWATWKRAWKHYDVEIKSWGQNKIRRQIKDFLGNREWFDKMKNNFEVVYNGQYDTWDYQWVYTQLKIKGMAIIPSKNLIENIGFRDDATHTKKANELIESKMGAQSLVFPLKIITEVASNEIYSAYHFSLLQVNQSKYQRLKHKMIDKFFHEHR